MSAINAHTAGLFVVLALEQFALIEALRCKEGHSVTLLCDNPEGPPNSAVEVVGDWTEWETRRFSGESQLDALRAAFAAMTAVDR